MMNTDLKEADAAVLSLPKAPTGIHGFDEITGGGLPRGRPTLVCGAAGCGKTLFALEFLVRGAAQYDEPGVYVSFEETSAEVTQNVRSLGFDLAQLEQDGTLVLDFVRIEPNEIAETGEYDLDGLFVRLDYAIRRIGAKRVVLDTIEALFAGLSNQGILRAELRRLLRWLKDQGITAVITGERGDGALTRHGLEEYVSDCVVLLDQRLGDQTATRRLRVVKYRGSSHGANEYPFLIHEHGFSVLPITSLGVQHEVSDERVSTGVDRLDTMLGDGYYRGSTVLVSGTAGSGKSSLAAHFARATTARDQRCLYVAFEESPGQIIRNMRSIGIDLEPAVRGGLLQFHSTRASLHGLEMHLVTIYDLVRAFRPQVVVLDPVSGLLQAGTVRDANIMLTRLIDFLKVQGITAFLTSLTPGGAAPERSDVDISSLVDTWLLLGDVESGGERNRAMYVLKSRGMAHSNQVREFRLTGRGIDLLDVYAGPEGVLTGSARLAQEARERAAAAARTDDAAARRRERDRKRQALEVRIAAMRQELESEGEEATLAAAAEEASEAALLRDRDAMASGRQADVPQAHSSPEVV